MKKIKENLSDDFTCKNIKASKNISIGKNTSIIKRNVKSNYNNPTLTIGNNCDIHANITFDHENAKLAVGDRTFIGCSYIVVYDNITIGSDVSIAWGCTIIDTNSHSIYPMERARGNWSDIVTKPIVIGDLAWIGFNSIILKGVTIGEGAVVGAGSVVTKDVAPYTVVAGNPAKFIKNIDRNR